MPPPPMSLRPRNHPNSGPSTPEPDTPAAHYTERMDLGTDVSRSAAAAHVHEKQRPLSSSSPASEKNSAGGPAAQTMQQRAAAFRLSGASWAARLRRKGLSQRVYLVITIVVGFILLTRFFVHVTSPSAINMVVCTVVCSGVALALALASLVLVPVLVLTPASDTTTNPTVAEIQELTPRDYLNFTTTDPAPFEFCPVFGPDDAVAARRGQLELLRSRVHLGTGARVQRVLRKAMNGMPVTISVLGGSVTACHGAGDDPIAPGCYPARLFNWWNSVFPHPANELTNGAVKRTDSAYYAYCSMHHLPDTADLIILEFDSSDPNDKEYLDHFELLVRSLLVRDDKPAVIILGHFSPQAQAQNGYTGPELLHNAVAQFYDVPHISAKGVLYDAYFEHPESVLSENYAGSHLINKQGHDLLADVLISYLMSQICSTWSTLLGVSFDAPDLTQAGEAGSGDKRMPLAGLGLKANERFQAAGVIDHSANLALEVPPLRLKHLPGDAANFREVAPYCVSAGDLVNPLPPSVFYGSGWATYSPKKSAVHEDRHYWYAEQPTSRLRVPLRVGAGDIGIYFLQQPPDKPAGTVKCWVDDNVEGAKTLRGNAETDEPIATLTIIDHNVAQGSHFVECMLDGEKGGPPTPFKILAVVTT